MKNKIPMDCVDKCIFIRYDLKSKTFWCELYNDKLEQTIKDDEFDSGVSAIPLRHDKCIRDKYATDIKQKIKDIKSLYDVFVFEMDTLFGELDMMDKQLKNIDGENI